MTQDKNIEMPPYLNASYEGDDLFTGEQLRAAVLAEREIYDHDTRVLMDALWKACGDDEEVVNATIESQGTLIKARGEQA